MKYNTIQKRVGVAALTVTELLVVIAVIGVLAALLLPFTNATRDRAHVAGCLNNLRQLGVAFQGYINDHDGYLPTTETPRSDKEGATLVWPYHVASYLEIKDFSKVYPNAELARKTPFVCPAEKEHTSPCIDYAINRNLRVVGGVGEKAYIKQVALRQPSKWVVLADSYKHWHLYNDRAQKMRDWNLINRRHGGVPNFLYADWHVEPFTAELIGESDAGGDTPFYKSLWFPCDHVKSLSSFYLV